MATSMVFHRVQDYDRWREVYDSDLVKELQKSGGLVEERVWRMNNDPDLVLVMHRFGSMNEAKRFFSENPGLGEAMTKAGVDTGGMRIEFFDEA